jgi:cytochrome c556
MRRILLRATIGSAVLFAPVAAVAGIALSPVMRSWNHSRRAIDAMLEGQAPYDEAQLRQDLQRYVAGASLLARDERGKSGAARDVAARFAAFADDARRVLDTVGRPAAVTAGYERMLGDCQSCHAIYT